MPPKHRQLHAPRPKASGNAFQALVDPPNEGIHFSFHGGDDRTDGSGDNTVVIANPRDSGPPASPQLQKDMETLEHLGRTATALEAFQTAILRLMENDDKQELYMHELNRQPVAISEGEMNAHDDDRTRTDDHTPHGNGDPPPCVLNNEYGNYRLIYRIRIRSTLLRISVNFQRVLRRFR
jgi:hypothetical protein